MELRVRAHAVASVSSVRVCMCPCACAPKMFVHCLSCKLFLFVALCSDAHISYASVHLSLRYTIWNVVGSPPRNVVVGRITKDGFVQHFDPVKGATKTIWPGNTTKYPIDKVSRQSIQALSIGWVMETAWATPAIRQESRMYAQQAIDEINANIYILPNTQLTLEADFSVNGNDKTVEAFNAIEARAKAAGRPLAAVLADSSSHMAAIYAPQADVTVTRRDTGVPIVSHYAGASVLSDAKRFPNFIRLYPPVSEVQHVYSKIAVRSFILYIPTCHHDVLPHTHAK